MYVFFGHLVAAVAHCAFFRFICFIVRLFISSIRAIYALKQRHAVKISFFFSLSNNLEFFFFAFINKIKVLFFDYMKCTEKK